MATGVSVSKERAVLAVVLGIVLIAIGFVLVVPRGRLPSSMISPVNPYAEIGFDGRSSRDDLDSPSSRHKRVRFLVGLGVMAIGVLCIVFGT